MFVPSLSWYKDRIYIYINGIAKRPVLLTMFEMDSTVALGLARRKSLTCDRR